MQIPFLFWNINKRPLQSLIARLAVEHDVRVVVLTECEIPPELMLAEFAAAGIHGFSHPSGLVSEGDIRIFVRVPDCDIRPVFDDQNNHVAIRRMVFKRLDWLVVVVHFQSKLNWSDGDQVHGALRLSGRIADAEAEFSRRRTVLVGDLNMNPFEQGIVGSEGLHAVMTRNIAAGKSRKVDAEERFFFYNPMWRFFGEREDGPPGTHYYEGSGKPISYFWNIFDQVMVRPELMNRLENVRILHNVANIPLLDNRGLPDTDVASDHLPLLFVMNLL